MEKIDNAIPAVMASIAQRVQNNKGYNRRNLWLRMSHSMAKDNHLNDLSGNAFKIFFIICTYMNKEKISYPSLDTLVGHSGMHKNTVQNAINEVEAKGWIAKERSKRQSNGRYGVMRYRILENDLVRSSNDPGFHEKPVTKLRNRSTGYQ